MTAMKRLVLLPILALVAAPLAGAATAAERLYQYCEVTSQHAQDNMLTNQVRPAPGDGSTSIVSTSMRSTSDRQPTDY